MQGQTEHWTSHKDYQHDGLPSSSVFMYIEKGLGAFLLAEVYFPMFLAFGFTGRKETALVVKQLEMQV